jgi:hypothetical protein
MASDRFIRIDFDGTGKLGPERASPDGRRKLRFRHKDLRDVVESTKRTVKELLDDTWNGWPYLLFYGLREADPRITLDKCSDLIDLWVDTHPDEELPMTSLGNKLREAFEAAGFIRTKPKEDEAPPAEPEGNVPAA